MTLTTDTDAAFMRKALALARKGLGRTSPNPAVGAVLVKGGRVMGSGYHRSAGLAHAEVAALESTAEDPRGSTLYVTLEPCCHHGRTPPCVDAVIRAGIRRVVVGTLDPNPRVSGRGVKRLEEAGMDVTTGVRETACRALNEAYNRHIATGLPFVTLKLASSLDGRIAAGTGHSRWITGPEARRLVHRMRSLSDALMVGGSTALADDPELTVRLVRGRDPVRVVVDSAFRVPLSSRIFKGPAAGRPGRAGTIVFTTGAADGKKIARATALGAEVVRVRKTRAGVDLKGVLAELGRREITSVLVEGGGTLAASLLRAGLVDKVAHFIAPAYIGGDGVPSMGGLGVRDVGKALRLTGVKTRRAGCDIVVEGYIERPSTAG